MKYVLKKTQFKLNCHYILTKLIVFLLFLGSIQAQELRMLEEGRKTSIRGLSVVNEKIVWASGSNGMVARTFDGGLHFDWIQVPGYAKRDFRDVEAFDAETAIIMAIDTPAVILKTRDGGKTWSIVLEDKRPGMFLDAMSFHGKSGLVVGDPIMGRAFLAKTSNAGDSWQVLDGPELVDGEAFFASSGSNVGFVKTAAASFNRHGLHEWDAAIVSGGMQSRFFIKNTSFLLPLRSGKNSSGANGIALGPDGQSGVIFGGDFASPKERDSSMLLFSFKEGRLIFNPPVVSPAGYKSHVVFLNGQELFACGTSGIDLSGDGGNTWRHISDKPFHVMGFAPGDKKAWLAGPGGSIAIIFKKDGLLK
ncbi:MAG: hypothetical protein RLZZ172_1489 [Bacteroidota bacterium]|jgi:photosystem II stability/assembly factor-like uncharacterized protein